MRLPVGDSIASRADFETVASIACVSASIAGKRPGSLSVSHQSALEIRFASFETPAARAPQDDDFLNAINSTRPSEERSGRAPGRVSKDAMRRCNLVVRPARL